MILDVLNDIANVPVHEMNHVPGTNGLVVKYVEYAVVEFVELTIDDTLS